MDGKWLREAMKGKTAENIATQHGSDVKGARWSFGVLVSWDKELHQVYTLSKIFCAVIETFLLFVCFVLVLARERHS